MTRDEFLKQLPDCTYDPLGAKPPLTFARPATSPS